VSGEIYMMRSLVICIPYQYYSGDQFEMNERGGTCRIYRRDERGIQSCEGETRGERDNLEDSGVDGRIILSWIFRKWDVGHGLD
jgi:hypothetical protein